eukprot:10496241-Lingulodinium_polyedra.AAC.1
MDRENDGTKTSRTIIKKKPASANIEKMSDSVVVEDPAIDISEKTGLTKERMDSKAKEDVAQNERVN